MRLWDKTLRNIRVSPLIKNLKIKTKRALTSHKLDSYTQIPDTVIVNINGILLPALESRESKEDRLPIGITYDNNLSQYQSWITPQEANSLRSLECYY